MTIPGKTASSRLEWPLSSSILVFFLWNSFLSCSDKWVSKLRPEMRTVNQNILHQHFVWGSPRNWVPCKDIFETDCVRCMGLIVQLALLALSTQNYNFEKNSTQILSHPEQTPQYGTSSFTQQLAFLVKQLMSVFCPIIDFLWSDALNEWWMPFILYHSFYFLPLTLCKLGADSFTFPGKFLAKSWSFTDLSKSFSLDVMLFSARNIARAVLQALPLLPVPKKDNNNESGK